MDQNFPQILQIRRINVLDKDYQVELNSVFFEEERSRMIKFKWMGVFDNTATGRKWPDTWVSNLNEGSFNR